MLEQPATASLRTIRLARTAPTLPPAAVARWASLAAGLSAAREVPSQSAA